MAEQNGRPLHQVAREIEANWEKVNFAARPYLDAMKTLDSIEDKYGYDDGRSIVLYFLSNAQTWRGEKAREIKKYLNRLLKG